MTPKILSCVPAWAPADLDEAVWHVEKGGLIVIPTDTVYGIGALASNPDAVAALLAAKGRGPSMPPPVLVDSPQALDRLAVEVPEVARKLAEAVWPGGLTLIVRARPELDWNLGQNGGTVALRMPDHARVLELIARTGPLAVSSANLTGAPPATSIEEAIASFPDSVLHIDSGPTPGSTPSTILDFAHGDASVIRLGTLSLEELSEAAGVTLMSAE